MIRTRRQWLPRPERGVDFPSNPPRGERGQTRLGATSFDDVVEFVPPFPDIGLGGGNDRELDAFVEHDTFLANRLSKGAQLSGFNQSG
jgi:hypothetical protein